jgi:osmoprotectant transport system permease protein
MSLTGFLREYDLSLLIALGEHLRLVGISLLIAVAIGVPLGATIARRERLAGPVIGIANLVQTIPSIALFGLMIPILSMIDRGIGAVPATIALVLYAQLPIIRNTYVALRQVPAASLDAARGMGMTERQIFLGIALPLAAPGIITGIRLAATMSIGVAAVAAYIGAGGLGIFIARGIATTWETMIVAGAIGVALLALIVELLLEFLERWLTPAGVRLAQHDDRSA